MSSCPSKTPVVLIVFFLALSTCVFGQRAQFYDTSSNLGLALATTQNATSTDLLFQLSAPKSAGWGAVGIGDQMDGALMFLMYPSSDGDDVTVSARSASGHDTPSPLPNVGFTVQSSGIKNSIMTANIICRNCTAQGSHESADISSSKQPWIWAIGPGDTGNDAVASDSKAADINEHSKYGTFYMKMTATRTSSTAIPSISGKANINVTALPSSVAALIIVHAICLAGSFLLLFPLGVIALRWFQSFRFHWMLQVFAILVCVIGLVVALAFSAMDPEYSSFNEGHQIIGIVAVLALVVQALLGYKHHRDFKKTGRRTAVSLAHLWLGRIVMALGMVNTILGFSLEGNTPGTIGSAIITIIILVITTALVFFGARRSKGLPIPSAPSSIILNDYNTPRGEAHGSRPGYGA